VQAAWVVDVVDVDVVVDSRVDDVDEVVVDVMQKPFMHVCPEGHKMTVDHSRQVSES